MVDNDRELQEVNNEGVEVAAESVQETDQGTQTETTTELQETKSAEPGKSDSGTDEGYVKHVQNWRALRDAKEKAERERDEAIRWAQQQGQQSAQPKQEPINLADDDLVEHKHVKRYKQEAEERIAQLEMRLVETQIKSKCPDFDEVVTQDTVGMLRDTDPDMAASILANRDPYSQAMATYKAIKLYGLSKPNYDSEKQVVAKNVNKPRTVTSLNAQHEESPLAKANAFATRLTDERKKQVFAEAMEIMRNR